MNYDNIETRRYIAFPAAEKPRKITLTCPITPGALNDRYRVRWESSIPGKGFTIISTGRYDIDENIHPASDDQYQCRVSIQHSCDREKIYNGPMFILEKKGKVIPCS